MIIKANTLSYHHSLALRHFCWSFNCMFLLQGSRTYKSFGFKAAFVQRSSLASPIRTPQLDSAFQAYFNTQSSLSPLAGSACYSHCFKKYSILVIPPKCTFSFGTQFRHCTLWDTFSQACGSVALSPAPAKPSMGVLLTPCCNCPIGGLPANQAAGSLKTGIVLLSHPYHIEPSLACHRDSMNVLSECMRYVHCRIFGGRT